MDIYSMPVDKIIELRIKATRAELERLSNAIGLFSKYDNDEKAQYMLDYISALEYAMDEFEQVTR